MKAHSSREAAKKLGISLMTLQRYIADGNWIKAPRLQTIGGVKVRLWTARDIERAGRLIKES
jgi:predicted site-specific integrase-resolvase